MMWWRAAAIALLATHVVADDQCYYANGDKAPDTEKPCSSAKGSACCPQNWECLDNGLCHYPPDNLFGRYSCTDKSWKSEGCPSNLCTYGMRAAGGESITQCSNHGDQWCCNADNVHVNCCKESPSPRPFFDLPKGVPYATVGSNTAQNAPNLAKITGRATGGGGDDKPTPTATSAPQSSNAQGSSGSPSGSPSPSPSGASSDPSAVAQSVSTGKPVTSVSFSLSSGSTGIVSVPITSVITPTSDASPSRDDGKGKGKKDSDSNLGLIIGCAVGIPLGLALIGVLFWLFRKRHQQKANPYQQASEMDGDNTGYAGAAAGKADNKATYRDPNATASEIDGNPVGAGRPISTVHGHAELASGNGFRPGHGTPYAPDAVGIGGGNGHADRSTWDSVPPQYSPGNHQAAFAYPNVSELADTSVPPAISEKEEHTAPAEMPAVRTPPQDVEKQMQR